MRNSLLAVFAAAISLTACGPSPEPLVQNQAAPGAAEPEPAVAPAISGGEAAAIAEGQRRTARAARFTWTGRFAAEPQLCEGGSWLIGRDRIVTDGETSCRVLGIEEQEARVALRLACTAEGMDTSESWTLAQAGEGLHVTRNIGGETIEVDLIPCRSR